MSKIWRLNFNDRTIKWDYFSAANMDNFLMLEGIRQEEKKVKDKKEKDKREGNNQKVLR